MKCVSCGTRAEPKDGTFTCTFCGYTQPLPKTWQLIGHSPTVTTYRPPPAESELVLLVTEWGIERRSPRDGEIDRAARLSAAQGNKPNHPGRLPKDDPRAIAYRLKQSLSHLGKRHRA